MTEKKKKSRGSAVPGLSGAADRYSLWVKDATSAQLARIWGTSLLIAVALLVVSELLPFDSVYVKAALSLPSALVFFFVGLGLAHKQHHKSGNATIKDKYMPAKRRNVAAVLLAVMIVFLVATASRIPYSLGGALMIASLLGILNLTRKTPEELAREEYDLPDPRDPAQQELPDIVDEDVWEREDVEEDEREKR